MLVIRLMLPGCPSPMTGGGTKGTDPSSWLPPISEGWLFNTGGPYIPGCWYDIGGPFIIGGPRRSGR